MIRYELYNVSFYMIMKCITIANMRRRNEEKSTARGDEDKYYFY